MSTALQDSEISPEFRQESNIPCLDSAAALQLLAALQLNPGSSIKCGHHQVTTSMAQCTKCASNSHQNGFTKIPLLSRTLSAPIPTKNLYDQFSDGILSDSLIRNPLLEENSGVNSTSAPTLPSHQPQKPIYRTYSEPIPKAYQAVATSSTPRAPIAGTCRAGFSLKPESPDTKSVRRMKDRLREMRKWWDEVIKEGEEEDDAGSENNVLCLPKDDCESSQGINETEEANHDQEAVWVERKGDVLILHFKCPCSKGYQILLSGNNCYYKLSSF